LPGEGVNSFSVLNVSFAIGVFPWSGRGHQLAQYASAA
jgi:hypothetical protein